MGKKDGRRADEAELEEEVEDAELQAELAAVLAARAEKNSQAKEGEEGGGGDSRGRATMYNKEGMLKCVEDIDRQLSFTESMVVCQFSATIDDENDDIEREMSFYNHTLSAVTAGRERMAQAGLPINRPNDYFCENVKTDAHMTRIKDRLLVEDKRIDSFELRKKVKTCIIYIKPPLYQTPSMLLSVLSVLNLY